MAVIELDKTRPAAIRDVAPLTADVGAIVMLRTDATAADVDPRWVRNALQRSGALVFRGMPPSVEGFKSFSKAYSSDFSDYKGGALRFGALARQPIGGDDTVLTVTGSGQGFPIPLHGEMYYMPEPPEVLWFYCHRPAEQGGETTVGSATAFHSRLSPATRAFFRDHRISYLRRLGDGDWQTTFMTDDPAEARAFAAAQHFQWAFDPEQRKVTVAFETSAIRPSVHGDGPAFINNIAFVQAGEDAFLSGWAAKALSHEAGEWPFVVCTADGAPIPRAIIDDIRRAERDVTAAIPWQAGDIALVDNRTTLHGRTATEDTAREIYVRLGMFGRGA